MKEVPIFIASSVREFEREREQVSVWLDMLNDVHRKDGARLEWYRPETMSRASKIFHGIVQKALDSRGFFRYTFLVCLAGTR